MGLQIRFEGGAGTAYEQALREIGTDIASAVEAAAAEAADLIRTKGRANIAAAGFSQRWQDGFGVKMTARTGEGGGFDVSLQVFHLIGYAAVFEGGATIHGRPLLWLPIEDNLPPPPGRQRWTPRRYARLVGPLASVQGRRVPLLVGRPPRRERAVPLFFGVPTVTIPDKFDLNEVVEEVMADFEQLYEKHLSD